MTNLDLKKMGLQELNEKEMIDLDGSWGKWALQLLLEDMFSNPGDYVSSGHGTALGHYGGGRP